MLLSSGISRQASSICCVVIHNLKDFITIPYISFLTSVTYLLELSKTWPYKTFKSEFSTLFQNKIDTDYYSSIWGMVKEKICYCIKFAQYNNLQKMVGKGTIFVILKSRIICSRWIYKREIKLIQRNMAPEAK